MKELVERMRRSEDEWKALHMAVWQYAANIEETYLKGKPKPQNKYVINLNASTSVVVAVADDNFHAGDSRIVLGLPGSRMGNHSYVPKELHSILVSRDYSLTLGHLQTLFSMFEDFLSKAHVSLGSSEIKINFSKWEKMSNFLNNKFKGVLDSQELKELKLAKETRNCFIHHDSKIDTRWLAAYEDARGSINNTLLGESLSEGLPEIFHEVENWHALISGIARKVEGMVGASNNLI